MLGTRDRSPETRPRGCLSGVADPHKIPIDSNGNLASKTEGADNWGYEWNAEDQLKRVSLNGNEVARFSYDPYGRRVEKVAGAVTSSYLYDGAATLREVRGGTMLKYVHGPGIDEPLAREDGSGALTYYHADGLGSILKRTTQAGAVVHEYRLDAWGGIEAGVTEPGYAFTGREWDPETGLYFYRARYYEPKVGRFISEDPLGFYGDKWAFAYVGNDPVNRVDPGGLKLTNRSSVPVLVKGERTEDGFIWVWGCGETYDGDIDGVKPPAFDGDWLKAPPFLDITITENGDTSPPFPSLLFPDRGASTDFIPGRKKEPDFSDRHWDWAFPPVTASRTADPTRPIWLQKNGTLVRLN